MSKKGAGSVVRVELGSDITIRNARSTSASLVGLVNSGSGVEIDCGAVEQADITFVQMMVSAEKTFAAQGLSFAMLAETESVRSAFERAGVPLPGAGPSEASRHSALSGN